MMSKFISNLFGTLGCAAVLCVILCMGYLASIISEFRFVWKTVKVMYNTIIGG